MHKTIRAVMALGLAAFSTLAFGQWELDSERSRVDFISIKNGIVAEPHQFQSLSGRIEADGNFRIEIRLDSVTTGIEVRDQRMRESLFDTGRFATATVTGRANPAVLMVASRGGVATSQVAAKLGLHGVEREVKVPLTLMAEMSGRMHVLSTRPVVLNAADFGLEAGVDALRKIAGLESISTAVPVTLNLVFNLVAE